jgi:asparagine synthase (glutamine-hydrolysing)
MAGEEVLIDIVKENGIGPQFFGSAYDIAMAKGWSIKSVISRALRQSLSSKGRSLNSILRPFVREDLVQLLTPDYLPDAIPLENLHPALGAVAELEPGNCLHILNSVYVYLEHQDEWGMDVGIPRIQPFLSQPVLEAAWKVPPWKFVMGGVDRSLERELFKDYIPRTHAMRTGKGNINEIFQRLCDENIREIEAKIVEGRLTKEGVICRKKLKALVDQRDMNRMAAHTLIELASWEDWIGRVS